MKIVPQCAYNYITGTSINFWLVSESAYHCDFKLVTCTFKLFGLQLLLKYSKIPSIIIS